MGSRTDYRRNGWVRPDQVVITRAGSVHLDLTGYGNDPVSARTEARSVLVREAADALRVDLFVPAEDFRELVWDGPTPTGTYAYPARSLWATTADGALTLRSSPAEDARTACTVTVDHSLVPLSEHLGRADRFVHHLGPEHLVLTPTGRLAVRDYFVDDTLTRTPEEDDEFRPVELTYDAEDGGLEVRLPFALLSQVGIGAEAEPVVVPETVYAD